jgi:hypothetical protein
VDNLAAQPCPKPCVECEDRQHHWLEMATNDEGEAVDPHFACKHCDATTPMCEDCLGPIVPVVDDGGLCAECALSNDEDA